MRQPATIKKYFEAAIISTPEGVTSSSPISLIKLSPVIKTSAEKSLCMFTNIFDVKKTAYRRVGAAKYKHKAIKYGNTPWELKQK